MHGDAGLAVLFGASAALIVFLVAVVHPLDKLREHHEAEGRDYLMHGGKLWEQHPAVRSGDELLFRERMADRLKAAFGTWSLLGGIVAGIIAWMTLVNDPGELHLNLALSFLASVQGVILQIAANRGDRISAEVAAHTRQNTDDLMSINQQQLAILNELRELREIVAGKDGAE